MCGEGSSLASQCLAFCQALASQGQAFNFSFKIGFNFSFCLDTRGVNPATPVVTRKKTSPSAKRRNARRRAQFLNKEQESLSPSSATSSISASPAPTSTLLSRSSPELSDSVEPETLRNSEIEKESQLSSLEISCDREYDSSAVLDPVGDDDALVLVLARCPVGGSCFNTNHLVTGILTRDSGDLCPVHPMCPLCEEEDSESESRPPRSCGFQANDPHGLPDSDCLGSILNTTEKHIWRSLAQT